MFVTFFWNTFKRYKFKKKLKISDETQVNVKRFNYY